MSEKSLDRDAYPIDTLSLLYLGRCQALDIESLVLEHCTMLTQLYMVLVIHELHLWKLVGKS